jgi:putative transposase
MPRDLLSQEEIKVGRKHLATPIRHMCVEALYRKPRAKRKHPKHRILSYWLRGLAIDLPNEVRGMDITYYYDGAWLRVPDGCAGLVPA